MKRLFFLGVGLSIISGLQAMRSWRTDPVLCTFAAPPKSLLVKKSFVTSKNYSARSASNEPCLMSFSMGVSKGLGGRIAYHPEWLEREIIAYNARSPIFIPFQETSIEKPQVMDQKKEGLNKEKLQTVARGIKENFDKKMQYKEDLEERMQEFSANYEKAMSWIYKRLHSPDEIGIFLLGVVAKLSLVLHKMPHESCDISLYPIMIGAAALIGTTYHLFRRYSEFRYRKVCEELHCEPNLLHLSPQKSEDNVGIEN